MRRMNLKRSFTAFALAAVMAASVLPAVPAADDDAGAGAGLRGLDAGHAAV